MPDLRTTLALVLGVGLGLVLLAFPEVVVRAHTVGRVPHDRSGEYGEDSSLPSLWRRAVQGIGIVLVLVAIYIWVSS